METRSIGTPARQSNTLLLLLNINQKDRSDVWAGKTWSGLTSFLGYYVWTDGNNIYYSQSTNQYVLDKATSTWSAKTWSGLTTFNGNSIWTDGENIYCKNSIYQYVLDKATSTWSAKTWSGFTQPEALYVWTDGENIYYSYNSNQYVLDKATSTWSAKSWSGYTPAFGNYVWTDGENIYYSNSSTQYVLDKTTSTWNKKTWSGLSSPNGGNIWTDCENIYQSTNLGSAPYNYVLNKATSTWSEKIWKPLDELSASHIWTDGNNIYYSQSTNQYVLATKGGKIRKLTINGVETTEWKGTEIKEITVDGVTHEMPSYTLSGVWVWDAHPNLIEDAGVDIPYSTDVSFISNGTSYSRIVIVSTYTGSSADMSISYVTSANVSTTVLDGVEGTTAVWNNAAYKTIDFGETPQTVSKEFYDYFMENANIQDTGGAI